MGETLFLSDLHLHASRPEATERFLELLAGEARDADAVYVLGDLFEAWIGDDDPEPEYRRAMAGMRGLSDSGVPLYFMHGNRDFLVGADFTRETACELLPDPTVVDLYGTPTMLSHGDAFCTDDSDYQRFRDRVRDPAWQAEFLAKSLDQRRAFAAEARAESSMLNAEKAEEIMDVNLDEVLDAMQKAEVRRLIHGHTHRPDVHHHIHGGDEFTRIVLGDWYEQGSLLKVYPGGYELMSLPLSP